MGQLQLDISLKLLGILRRFKLEVEACFKSFPMISHMLDSTEKRGSYGRLKMSSAHVNTSVPKVARLCCLESRTGWLCLPQHVRAICGTSVLACYPEVICRGYKYPIRLFCSLFTKTLIHT